MSLLSNAVKVADSVTKSLGMQVRVTVKQFVQDGGTGDNVEKDVKASAVVSKKTRTVRSFGGELVAVSTTVTFVNGKITIGEHDRIFLPDGSGGPVVGTSSPVDASGKLITEAYLG